MAEREQQVDQRNQQRDQQMDQRADRQDDAIRRLQMSPALQPAGGGSGSHRQYSYFPAGHSTVYGESRKKQSGGQGNSCAARGQVAPVISSGQFEK